VLPRRYASGIRREFLWRLDIFLWFLCETSWFLCETADCLDIEIVAGHLIKLRRRRVS